MRARFVDLRDAGVLEAAKQLRLEFKSPQRRLGCDAPLHHLHRYAAAGLLLHGLVHGAHAARADDALQCEGADEVEHFEFSNVVENKLKEKLD